MPYLKKDAERVQKLFAAIERRKRGREFQLATYEDVPAMREMYEIISANKENDEETVTDRIAVLSYLAENYLHMHRAPLAAPIYKEVLSAYAVLAGLRALTKEECGKLEEDAFYAAKARNFYTPDTCDDLYEILKDTLAPEKLEKAIEGGKSSRKGMPKYDPVEATPEYLAVIDEVERLIDENKTMNFCMEIWNLQSQYLEERGIHWRSPVILNPGWLFD